MPDPGLPPVPIPFSPDPRHLLDWALQLTAWINLVGDLAYPLEEQLALGGVEMASRMFGIEHTWEPDTTFEELVPAPEAGKKRIITFTHTTGSTTGGSTVVALVKRVAAVNYIIGAAVLGSNASFTENGPTQIVLDGIDESLGIITDTDETGNPYYFEASYLDVD